LGSLLGLLVVEIDLELAFFGFGRAGGGVLENPGGLEDGERDAGIGLRGRFDGGGGGVEHGEGAGAGIHDGVGLPGVVGGLEIGVAVEPAIEGHACDTGGSGGDEQLAAEEHVFEGDALGRGEFQGIALGGAGGIVGEGVGVGAAVSEIRIGGIGGGIGDGIGQGEGLGLGLGLGLEFGRI
jgi:hypothetical protein